MESFKFLIKLSVSTALIAVLWRILQSYKRLPPVVEGFFQPEYRPVAELFRKYIEDGTEQGGSFAVYHKGKPLIELWGGYVDPVSRKPWREDTLTVICADGAVALAVAKLVQKGLLDYNKEVKHYWPEFGQNGKDNITIEMLLNHQISLINFGGENIYLSLFNFENENDWQISKHILEDAFQDSPSGTSKSYQSFILGAFVNVLIRLLDWEHLSLIDFFKQEVQPLGIDYYFKLPENLNDRATHVFINKVWGWSSPLIDFLFFFTRPYTALNSSEYSKMIIGEERNGKKLLLTAYSSARHLARLYSGDFAGKWRILSEDFIKSVSILFTEGNQEYSNNLYLHGFQIIRNSKGGWILGHDAPHCGGQLVAADPQNDIGMAYTTNFLHTGKSLPDHLQHLQRLFCECHSNQRTKGIID